jgi:rubrerythrin
MLLPVNHRQIDVTCILPPRLMSRATTTLPRFSAQPGKAKPAMLTVTWNTSAIAGETHEYTDMYPGMAKSAREEGFDEIADWFETLAKAERSHANRFQKALDNLDS